MTGWRWGKNRSAPTGVEALSSKFDCSGDYFAMAFLGAFFPAFFAFFAITFSFYRLLLGLAA
jgi:hypothetical protein